MNKLKEPMHFVNGWRFLTLAVLTHLWIIGQFMNGSFILILLLFIMTSLRWRFALPAWSALFDLFFCFLFAPYTDVGYYGIVLPMFELALVGKSLFSLLLFTPLLFLPTSSDLLFWFFFQAFFFGVFAYQTLKNQQTYKLEADEQRKARYELERIKLDLLAANQSVSKQAGLMERFRISRELHDHLGHDLTGALLALQAYEYVKNPKDAEMLLEQVKDRLERSTKRLRETVHNITPTTLIGVENLEAIVQQIKHINVQWKKTGNMLQVPAYIWSLLEVCLKEAFTNVVRHSNATKVEVDLNVTDTIVRLGIQDDGTLSNRSQTGSGLRSLQMRARSLGGSVSINRDNGFLLVCVIPLEKEELVDETFNS
ncbi:sensor histidine kinase [Bacillus sp. JCM 19034]|uniref:sensor histidine kinase n=1 Tax=Bacillus sp. JCM 19034 TaxID=1481928 RepID=UPI000783112E|nr:histidine kinase [Bacillus sp. JCM 19034]